MKKSAITLLIAIISIFSVYAERVEKIKYGDFENWVTRIIPESRILGGHKKNLYEIAPTTTIEGNKPYKNMGGSPWATSNVLANVMGIVKGSNAVYPDNRTTTDKCARLSCIMEHCKAIGIINVDVVVAGSIFLGEFMEPVKSTSEPYSKMEMGVPFTGRPSALQFDYKLEIPEGNSRTYSSGFGKKKTMTGNDCAEVYIILQRRWEDKDGNIYANRVGTGRRHLTTSTEGWQNGYRIPVLYGNITSHPDYKPYMGLIPEDKSYYARNSKGKMVPVKEVGWDASDATPTHMLVMASAGSGTAYIGTIGLNLWVDNFALVYP
ncbi:MAG: PCMD domain-containing protein [Muribaculaceae bacterium]|nr:PCMD domain-containing protein [Muribaculaceae bacterium]